MKKLTNDFEINTIKETQIEILKDLCKENRSHLRKKLMEEEVLNPDLYLGLTEEELKDESENYGLSTVVKQTIRENHVLTEIEKILENPTKRPKQKIAQIHALFNKKEVINKLERQGKEYDVISNIISAIRSFIADNFGIWRSRGHIMREFIQDIRG